MNDIYASMIFLVYSIIALWIEINTRQFISKAHKTVGTIIEVEDVSIGSNSRFARFPTIEFSTQNGRIYQFRSSSAISIFSKVGSHVGLYYDPERPDDKVLIIDKAIWLHRISGVMSLGVSIYLLVHHLK